MKRVATYGHPDRGGRLAGSFKPRDLVPLETMRAVAVALAMLTVTQAALSLAVVVRPDPGRSTAGMSVPVLNASSEPPVVRAAGPPTRGATGGPLNPLTALASGKLPVPAVAAERGAFVPMNNASATIGPGSPRGAGGPDGGSTSTGGAAARATAFSGAVPAAAGWSAEATLYLHNNSLWHGDPLSPARHWVYPQYAAYDPVTGLLYVSDGGSHVTEVDPGSFQTVGVLSLPMRAGTMLYDSAAGLLVVESYGSVLWVNPLNGSVGANLSVPDASASWDGTLLFDPAQDSLWVTSSYAGNVSVVDLGSESVRATIPVPSLFVNTVSGTYDPVNGQIYLTNWDKNEVLIFNATTGLLAGNLSLDNYNLFAAGAAADPVTGNVYVTDDGFGASLVEISGLTGKPVGALGVGGFASGATYDPVTGRLYVADAQRSRVTVVDPATFQVVGTERLAQANPLLVAQVFPLDVPELGRLYVPTLFGGTLDWVSATDLRSNGSLDPRVAPELPVYDAACACLIVPGADTGELYFVNTTSGEVEHTVPLSGSVSGLVYDDATGELWVTVSGFFSASAVLVLNGATGTVVSTTTDNQWPEGIALDPTTDRVFVADAFGNNVSVYNSSSLAPLERVSVGGFPVAVAYVPDTGSIVVGNDGSSYLSILNGSSGAVVATQATPVPADSLGFDPTTHRLFVALTGSPWVEVLNASSLANLAELAVPYPSGFAFDPTSGTAFVTNYSGGVFVVNASGLGLMFVTGGIDLTTSAWVPGSGLWAADAAAGSVVLIASQAPSWLTDVRLTILPGVVALGEPLELSASSTGGTGPVSYTFVGLPPGCTDTGSAAVDCTPSSAGAYAVTLFVNDSGTGRAEIQSELWVVPAVSQTFEESGLPAGSWWSVTVDGGPTASTTSTSLSIVVLGEEEFGYFAATTAAGFVPVHSPAAANATPDDLPVVVRFAETYPVSFRESGLWEPASWSLVVHGRVLRSSGVNLSVALPNGSYFFAVPTVANYAPVRLASVSVQGGAVEETLSFVRVTFFLQFQEVGLPTGWAWEIQLNSTGNSTHPPVGLTLTAGSSSAAFLLGNGSYAYLVTGPFGYELQHSSPWGYVTVAGGNLSVALTYAAGPTPDVTFTEVGLPARTTWCVTIAVRLCSGSSTVALTHVSPARYPYELSPPQGYRPHPGHGVLAVGRSDVSKTVRFLPVLHRVRFLAVDLFRGTPWSVTVVPYGTHAATTVQGHSAVLALHLPEGTYNYTVPKVPGFGNSSSGEFFVYLYNKDVAVFFHPPKFTVSFQETGLPNGTTWVVSIQGTETFGYGSVVNFSEPNGTYRFHVGSIQGYALHPVSHRFTLEGTTLVIHLVFGRK